MNIASQVDAAEAKTHLDGTCAATAVDDRWHNRTKPGSCACTPCSISDVGLGHNMKVEDTTNE